MSVINNHIYVGSLDNPSFEFHNDQILSCSSVQAVALVGQELSMDTFSPVVMDDPSKFYDIYHYRVSGQEIRTGDGKVFAINADTSTPYGNRPNAIINIPDGTPVWYYHDEELVGKFYVESVDRRAKNQFRINCTSFIGLLDKMDHGGGYFRSTTFGTVLAHIMASGLHGDGNPVVGYAIDDEVAALPVSGWLPYASKRENLYQLVLANGVNIVKNVDGNPRFTFIYTGVEDAPEIPVAEIFDTGTVEYEKPYSSVEVLEHTYTADTNQASVVLFDNTSGDVCDHEEVLFSNAPIITSTIAASGLTVHSSTENSAIVSGTGTLSGIPYIHSTRAVSMENEDGASGKRVSVQNCTMVNTINSQNLLLRLYAFYCPETTIRRISNSVVRTDQRCGKVYRITNPYGETENALLATMNTNAGSFLRADCEFYADYVPEGQRGLYKHVAVLDASTCAEDGGVFTVPESVFEADEPIIKVVLIGGGTGGTSGSPGENGKDAQVYIGVRPTDSLESIWYGAEGGEGGQGGAGGAAGKVLSVSITNPSATYNYTVGTGGAGGAQTGFIPDTAEELRAALEAENPDTEYTAAEIAELLAEETALTDWNGTPNAGTAGTASTFGNYSTEDQDAYVPTGGVYNPFYDTYYALTGLDGITGGAGGARESVDLEGQSSWYADGENVMLNGTTYYGGAVGMNKNTIPGLDAEFILYGGNGAGAAVGIDRTNQPNISGGNTPPMLRTQYLYDGAILGYDYHILPGGKAYSFATRTVDGDIGDVRYVVRPQSQAITGTMANANTDVSVSCDMALCFTENTANGNVLTIRDVDELSVSEGVVTISGDLTEAPRNTVQVTLTGALSGRSNDPLYDDNWSYYPETPQAATVYGQGGRGGHGGSGGAGASTVVVKEYTPTEQQGVEMTATTQRHGYGSGGGAGGQGGPGCILVYYP